MNADQIYEAIKARHFGESWLVIGEAPTTTGWGQRAGRIDAYAVGLWAENRGFIAYEIKVSRQDFLKDLEQFAAKQAVALANSTQFYYAAPYGLLRADEMPEGCGLLEVQNGRTVTTKAAAIRQLDGMNPRFIAAILRAALVTREKESKHAWRYMGREMTMEDVLDLAKRESNIHNESRIEYEVRNRMRGNGTEAERNLKIAARVLGNVGWSLGVDRPYGMTDEQYYNAIEETAKTGTRGSRDTRRLRMIINEAEVSLRDLKTRLEVEG